MTTKPLHTQEPQPEPQTWTLTVRLTAMTVVSVLFVNACGSGMSAVGSHQMNTDEPAANEQNTDEAAANEPNTDEAAANEPNTDEPAANEPFAAASTLIRPTPNAVVERVVDGDTFTAKISGRSESVRLLGIDTPESVARTRPVQCYGKEASIRLAEMLPTGTDVTLVRDVEARDAYNRLLAYVVRSDDDLFVNLRLVDEGYAAILNYPPNDYYADVLKRAESAAKTAGRGLWSACGGPDVPLE